MRTCLAFLLLAACCYQMAAECQVPPLSGSEAKNGRTRLMCPLPPDHVPIAQPMHATTPKEDQQKQKEGEQAEGSKQTLNMAPAEDVITSRIEQEPTRTQKENAKTHFENPSQTTAAAKAMPKTVQEPTMVTTEAPNWCKKNDFIQPWPQCKEAVEDVKKLTTGLTKFSLELFHQILEMERNTNVVFSPLSIAMVLSNLLLGARGDTKDLLLDTLFDVQNSNNADCIHTNLRNLNFSQSLESASGMFYRKDLSLNDFFLAQSKEFYNVHPVQLTSHMPKNLQMVNEWVAEKTHGRILQILEDLPKDMGLILLNAIFFQGEWKTPFNSNETRKGPFFVKNWTEVMMMTSRKYPLVWFSDHILKARIGRFPLSQNMSMLIFLPQLFQNPLSDLEDLLSYEVFQDILLKLDNTLVNPTMVFLPKFKVDSKQELMDVFRNTRLYELFHSANLCGICASEAQLSGGTHRAVLQMDESGVVAAAASAVTIGRSAQAPTFEVRQPFMFVVWSDQGKFPVMMGRINDPNA